MVSNMSLFMCLSYLTNYLCYNSVITGNPNEPVHLQPVTLKLSCVIVIVIIVIIVLNKEKEVSHQYMVHQQETSPDSHESETKL